MIKINKCNKKFKKTKLNKKFRNKIEKKYKIQKVSKTKQMIIKKMRVKINKNII